MARAQRPDIIILDTVLGDMPGKEVATRLREDPRTNSVPIIFLDALSSAEDETEMEHFSTGEKTFAKLYNNRKLLVTLGECLFGPEYKYK